LFPAFTAQGRHHMWEGKHIKPHDLRSIYAALVMGMFNCPFTFPQVAKLILGHNTVAESLHYQNVRVLPCAMRNGPLLIDC
jgi:hypothetical protein